MEFESSGASNILESERGIVMLSAKADVLAYPIGRAALHTVGSR